MRIFNLKKVIISITSFFSKKETIQIDSNLQENSNETIQEKTAEILIQEEKNILNKDFSFVEKNDIFDRINSLRVTLSRIEFVCKEEFLKFSNKLNNLEDTCKEEYKRYKEAIAENKLVFTCDPKFNSKINNELIKIKNEIDTFINQVGKYKILEERIEKLHKKLLNFYDQYKRGLFKDDFQKVINQAKDRLEQIIIRVLGEEELLLISDAQNFIDKKSLNDKYNNLLYLIEKCEIYYMLANNNFTTLKIKETFQEEFLIFLMKDLESIKKDIKSLEGTCYYGDLIEKFQKLKSVNISDIDEVLNSEFFFEDFISIEIDIEKAEKKIAADNIKKETQNILKIFKQ